MTRSRTNPVRLGRFVCFALIGVAAFPLGAESQTLPAGPLPVVSSQETDEIGDGLALHLKQLANCRAGISDAQARPDDRRRWVDLLFSFDTPQAKGLIVELLRQPGESAPVVAVCEAIASRARTAPQFLDDSFVDPLLALLRSDNADLRAAASSALADFPSETAMEQLGAWAQDPSVPLHARQAAIDALGARVDDRSVVRVLMSLLNQGPPEIVDRVVAALEPTARESLGRDLRLWQDWWAEKERMSESAWLEDQILVYRDRLRRTQREFRGARQESQRQLEAANSRIKEFQREVFRLIPPDQRDARLIAWMEDPVEEVKRTALSLIRTQIADEGRRPEGDALAALLRLLQHEAPTVRREVLQIVQTLKNPSVEEAVLTLLQRERDPSVRQAVFRAVGQLELGRAAEELLREIESPSSSADNVREAATTLGQVAARVTVEATRERAAAVLRSRYTALQPEDHTVRAGLLSAMVGLRHPSFREVFQDAIERTDPATLREAARGLAALSDLTKLPRLRMLTGDADQLVRRAALEAVGALGREDADIEAVSTRLYPANEPQEVIRETAWKAFRSLVDRKPLAARVAACKQLRDLPEHEIACLESIAAELTNSPNDHRVREEVHDRLGELMMTQRRFDQAASALGRLTDLIQQRGGDAFPAGVRWLEAGLRGESPQDVAAVVRAVAPMANDPAKQSRFKEVLRMRFAGIDARSAESARQVLAVLREALPGTGIPGWESLMDQLERELPKTVTAPSP